MASYKRENIEAVSEEIHEMWMSWAKNIIATENEISSERKGGRKNASCLIQDYLKR